MILGFGGIATQLVKLLAPFEINITPHTAGGHADESGTLVRHFLTNLKWYLEGSPLADRIM